MTTVVNRCTNAFVKQLALVTALFLVNHITTSNDAQTTIITEDNIKNVCVGTPFPPMFDECFERAKSVVVSRLAHHDADIGDVVESLPKEVINE